MSNKPDQIERIAQVLWIFAKGGGASEIAPAWAIEHYCEGERGFGFAWFKEQLGLAIAQACIGLVCKCPPGVYGPDPQPPEPQQDCPFHGEIASGHVAVLSALAHEICGCDAGRSPRIEDHDEYCCKYRKVVLSIFGATAESRT